MSELVSFMVHSSNIITGDRLAIGFLLIVLIGMFLYREHRKSSIFLAIAIGVQAIGLLADSIAFSYDMNGKGPLWLINTVYYISYTFVILMLIFFGMYVYTYIKERTTIGRWAYIIPVSLNLISFIILSVSIFSGKVFAQVEGVITVVGESPLIVRLIQYVLVLYYPVIAIIKRKALGIKSVLILGLFGVIPATVMFINYDYSMMFNAYALVAVYVLIQCDIRAEKEKQRSILEKYNMELSEVNGQLEKNQVQLEESMAEQEAQLEEITALNSELEERQAQLEELTTEQESQIEEISELNVKLESTQREAEKANNAKTTFLFNMSHDIRTPMNAIIGFRDLLEKHQDDSEKRADYLRKIKESSDVLLSIINNVLEMARIEKGTIEIEEVAWSAEQFNDTLYSVFGEMMNEKGINFTRKIDVIHPYIYCDNIKLREVFINILSNAYKYTNAGGSVDMLLEELPSEREGYVYYKTTITDTGIGMSEEFLPNIFKEFERERNTTDNKIEGTGLGMSIVKRIIDIMGGTIEIKSKEGEGTIVVVTIPHRIAEKSDLVAPSEILIDPTLFEGKRILLAEDNDLNAEIAIEILREAGFIVDRAEDGAICCEKLNAADSDYYDLILMDIQMPKMNGYEATKTIRAMSDISKANIPIIAMTANAFEEDKQEALSSGMNGHIAKPINPNILESTLAEILNK